MYEFDKLYRSIIGEGKADPSDKKGSKLSWNKHRNKQETRQSSRKSRKQGKASIEKEITESLYSFMRRGKNAENYKEVLLETPAALLPAAGAVLRAVGPSVARGVAAGAISNLISGGGDEEAENYGGDDDFIDLHYNLKDFLDKFGRDLEKSYHYYKSIDAPGFSEAGDLVESVIDAIDDINEQAQGEGTREEFVELKDKVHDLVRDLNDMYEDVGSEAQNVIEQIIDELNDELETY